MSPGATTDTLVAFRMEAPAAAEDGVVTALWERGTTGVHSTDKQRVRAMLPYA